MGVVFLKDLFVKYTSGREFKITDVIRPVKFVPSNTVVSAVLNQLQKAKTRLAVVLDDYRGTVGVVTIEDVIES